MMTLAQKAFIDTEGQIESNEFEVWAEHASFEFVGNTEHYIFMDGSHLFFDIGSKQIALSGGFAIQQY